MNILRKFSDNIKNPEITKCLEDLINSFDGTFCTTINSNTIVRTAIIIKEIGDLGYSKIFYGTINSELHFKLLQWIKNGLTDKDEDEAIELYKNAFNVEIKTITSTSIIEILYKLIISNQISEPKKIYEIMNAKKSQRIEECEFYKLLKDSKEDTHHHLMYGAFDFDFDYEGPILEYI